MTGKFDRYKPEIPALVRQAMSLAEELGFPLMPEGRPAGYQGPPSACIPEVGRLLSVLAAGCPNGKVAEFGTGAGVGTAWLLHGLPATSRLFSAEKAWRKSCKALLIWIKCERSASSKDCHHAFYR